MNGCCRTIVQIMIIAGWKGMRYISKIILMIVETRPDEAETSTRTSNSCSICSHKWSIAVYFRELRETIQGECALGLPSPAGLFLRPGLEWDLGEEGGWSLSWNQNSARRFFFFFCEGTQQMWHEAHTKFCQKVLRRRVWRWTATHDKSFPHTICFIVRERR